jgi:hypothetical protein
MKYFFSVIFSIVLLNVAIAQDFKKVQTFALLGKIEEAKTENDKLMADPKNQAKSEGWYWKSRLNAALAKGEATKAKFPNAFKDADEATKKYVSLDPSFAIVKEKGADGFFDMYGMNFNAGLADFTAKLWPKAVEDFEAAVYYSDFIFQNKWANLKAIFDTTSILYAAYSNQNAQKMDRASIYYSRLAEAKSTGENFQEIYKFLADHATKKKDEDSFYKALNLGKEVYPKENWDDYEVEYIDENFTLAQKTEFYDKGDVAATLSEMQYLHFGDVFVNVRHKEKDSTLFDRYTTKGVESFKKAYAKNDKSSLAAYNVAVIHYNYFNVADDKYGENIRSLQQLNANRSTDKDPKKKAAADAKLKEQTDAIKKANIEVDKVAQDNIDIAIEWLNKTYTILKDKNPRTNTEKGVINKSVDFLANLYSYKMNKVRGKDPKAFDAFEAKYKEFDALHSTFK